MVVHRLDVNRGIFYIFLCYIKNLFPKAVNFFLFFYFWLSTFQHNESRSTDIFDNVVYSRKHALLQENLLIFQETDSVGCADWHIYRHTYSKELFSRIIEVRDDAAFYSVEEDKSQVIIQKTLPDKNIFIRKIIKHNSWLFEARLITCKKQLSRNKNKIDVILQDIVHNKSLDSAIKNK